MSISTLITNSGKTRSQILQETGMSQSYLSLVESGARKVGQKYALRLANALGVSVAEIRPDWGKVFEQSSIHSLRKKAS